MTTTNWFTLRDPSADCRGGRISAITHPWVCLRAAADHPDGIGLVRVTCSECGHEFDVEYQGSLMGRGFTVPSHEPSASRFYGPAHIRELASRAA